MERIEILSVNISVEKGTSKEEIPFGELTLEGLRGDAHAGAWHRQISFLDISSVDKIARETSGVFKHGDFGENFTTSGLDFSSVKPGDRLYNNNVELEITQIGKSCHGSGCAIFRTAGKCAMPSEGVFAKVIRPGKLNKGDLLKHLSPCISFCVITLSSRAYSGIYEDKSGPVVQAMLNEYICGEKIPGRIKYVLLPDKPGMLKKTLEELISDKTDIIITTGGTGIGPEDITPDVVKPMLDKELQGIMEFIRYKYGSTNKNALLSRSCAGLASKSLIFCIPGSVKAATEYMQEITPMLSHLCRMKSGSDRH